MPLTSFDKPAQATPWEDPRAMTRAAKKRSTKKHHVELTSTSKNRGSGATPMSSRRKNAYRPCGEGLETKALLSPVVGWGGGNGGGNSDSLITPANISNLTEQYSHSLDGIILDAPVSATVDVTVGPDQGTQNLVFVATANDSLYAFNTATGQLAWQTNFLKPGESTLPTALIQTGVNGTTSTPLIDPSTNTIYLTTTEAYNAGNINYYTKTLHAVDMSDGQEMPGSPVVIADTGYENGKPVSFFGPSVKGTGAGSVHGRVQFDVPRELQRPGLSLDGNNLLIAFGSYGDIPPFHGWILAYNMTTLQPTGVFNDTPNGSDGGIWNSGNPIVVDSQGFLYTETGNGTFDTTHNRTGLPSRGDYGDAVLKLKLIPGYSGPNGTGMKVVDYFAPRNQAKLEKTDGDLASSGVLILPDGMGGPKHPDLLLASGKSGTVYVINRNDMGHYYRGSNHIVQTLPNVIGGSYDTPAIFNNTIYYAGVDDAVKSFTMKNGLLVQTGESTNTLPWPGATPVISSDGTTNGIVWVVSASNQLIAYDPTNLSNELWSAPLPDYSHFAIPTITSDGHVFVGVGGDLVAFGPRAGADNQ
jgi:PQQ-like domain